MKKSTKIVVLEKQPINMNEPNFCCAFTSEIR